MTMAVSKAVEEGATAVICASTGNTSAVGRRLRRPRRPDGRGGHPRGQDRRRQAGPGAGPRRPRAGPGRQLRRRPAWWCAQLVERHPIALVNSLNEYRIDGQRTGAFEVCDDLGDAPDVLCIPVGNAGNISAYWLGFQAYREAERSRSLPRLYGFQAAGRRAAGGRAPSWPGPRPWPPRSASATPPAGDQAMDGDARVGRRRGGGDRLPDPRRPTACWRPRRASSASRPRRPRWPGSSSAPRPATSRPGERVVCVLTGHGLKDPDTAIVDAEPVRRLPADFAAVEEAVFG